MNTTSYQLQIFDGDDCEIKISYHKHVTDNVYIDHLAKDECGTTIESQVIIPRYLLEKFMEMIRED